MAVDVVRDFRDVLIAVLLVDDLIVQAHVRPGGQGQLDAGFLDVDRGGLVDGCAFALDAEMTGDAGDVRLCRVGKGRLFVQAIAGGACVFLHMVDVAQVIEKLFKCHVVPPYSRRIRMVTVPLAAATT